VLLELHGLQQRGGEPIEVLIHEDTRAKAVISI
jgi:hypothetical protein